MHNINFIRDNPVIFDNFMKQRGELPCSKNIIKIDEDKRNTQTVLQNLLAERNKLSKEIGILKSQNKDSEVENILKRVEKIKDETSNLKELEKIKEDELHAILSRLPNIPANIHLRAKMKMIIFYIENGEIKLNLILNLKDIMR